MLEPSYHPDLMAVFTPEELADLFPRMSFDCSGLNTNFDEDQENGEIDLEEREMRRGAYSHVKWEKHQPSVNSYALKLNELAEKSMNTACRLQFLRDLIKQKRSRTLIKDDECCAELLRFVCPNMECKLFEVDNGKVDTMEGLREWETNRQQALTLAGFLLPFRVKGEQLVEFLASVETVFSDSTHQMPSAIAILYNFILKSIADISLWTQNHIDHGAKDILIVGVKPRVCERLTLLLHLISPIWEGKRFNALATLRNWDAVDNEQMISSLLVHTNKETMKEDSWLAPLQNDVITFLLKYLDSLYYTGTVHPQLSEEFVFYVPPNCPIHELAVRTQISYFWRDSFLTEVLRGASYRYQAGPEITNMISTLWRAKHWEMYTESGSRRTYDIFTVICDLEKVCREATEQINNELISQLRASNIKEVLRDFQMVSRGSLYNMIESQMIKLECSTTEAFRISCKGVKGGWSLKLVDGGNLGLHTELSKIVSLVLPPALFVAVSHCCALFLKICRALRNVTETSIDRRHLFLVNGSRRFRRTLFDFEHLLNTLVICFDELLDSLWERHIPSVTDAPDWDQVKQAAKQLSSLIKALTDRESSRKMVHDSIDILCKAAEDIRLAVLSRAVTPDKIHEWEKVTSETRKMFVLLGESVPNTVLSHVSARLK